MIPDPDDPAAYQGQRFLATAYRTTRAILSCKRLLFPGRSIGESIDERLEGDLLSLPAPIEPTSMLGAVADEAGALPTIPTPALDDEAIQRLATVHGFAALQCGMAPDDECLHWFQAPHLATYFPSQEALLAFENALLVRIGKRMISKGKQATLALMTKVFGPPSHWERRDWLSLPLAYVRDFSSESIEDDRTLMEARLESITNRARQALDLRTELAASRELSAIKGLRFQDDEAKQRQYAILLAQSVPKSLDLAQLPAPATKTLKIAETG